MTDKYKDHLEPSTSRHPSAGEEADPALPALAFLTHWNMEIMTLYGKRMQEYCMMPFSLMLCTSADDFTDLQDKFCATLQADYATAAGKLALAVGDADEGGSATENYASVLLKAQEDARAIIEQARAQADRIMEAAKSRTQTQTAEARASAAA